MALKEIRMAAGFTQKSLAEASGVSLRMIQQWETGARNIDGANLDSLCRIAITLKCTLFDIIKSDDLKRKLKDCV